MLIKLIKAYANLHEFFHEKFSVNIRGLGFLYRQIKKDSILKVKGKELFFNHKVADNYGRLINGNFNEPETHKFLDSVFKNQQIDNFHFVDIGGNVGEFVLDYSSNLNVQHVTVFEPQPEQALSIEKTIKLNNFEKTTLIKSPVSNKVEEVLFNINSTNSGASGITQDFNAGIKLLATTIDNCLGNQMNQTFVFLIDTEGAELEIMKGGNKLIQEKRPLLIFEYNHVTRRYFNISDVQVFLGNDYKIYRLRKDGKLDNIFENTWNLVAIPNSKQFEYLNKIIH